MTHESKAWKGPTWEELKQSERVIPCTRLSYRYDVTVPRSRGPYSKGLHVFELSIFKEGLGLQRNQQVPKNAGPTQPLGVFWYVLYNSDCEEALVGGVYRRYLAALTDSHVGRISRPQNPRSTCPPRRPPWEQKVDKVMRHHGKNLT